MSNVLNTPIQQSFTQGVNKNLNDNNQLLGKSLPAHVVAINGSIVTVAFDVVSDFTLPTVTVPVLGFEYIRYPIQIGDKGAVIAFDARLGENSGLGQNATDLSQPGNLSALIFCPFGNINWFGVNPNALTLYGIDGVVIQDTEAGSIITLTPTTITIVARDSVTIQINDTLFVIRSDGSFELSATGHGLITAVEGVTISDTVNSIVISHMYNVFNDMISFFNNHTHPVSGSEAEATDTPYTGGNPIL